MMRIARMLRRYGTTTMMLALAGLAGGGCGTDDERTATPTMTAEEHARMQAGAGSGDEPSAKSRQTVHLTTEQERALGVVYTTVRREPLTRTIRTVGRIEAPEPGIADITPKIEGFVERLHVSTTGETVRVGGRLLTIYSPQLVAAQEELLTAKRLASQIEGSGSEAWRNARSMLDGARRRLAYWDITDDQIERVERTGEVTKTLTLVAPVSGIVLEKNVLEGQRVMPGQRLYRIADLSTVWVEGDVFEQDLQFVQAGSRAHIEVAAYPGVHMMGQVSFVYPTVDERSRTNRVRLTVDNPDLRLKPGMFATMYLDAKIGEDAPVVPHDAVVVTGERNLVFLRTPDGMLEPREVVLGARAGNRVQILQGLTEGQTIVASANFLVDAESRLAGTRGMPGTQHAGHGSAVEPGPEADREERRHD